VKRLVFAALAINAIIWGAGTVRQLAHEYQVVKDTAAAWSITESVTAPDLSIHV
jgi:hypothetical protein